MKLDDLTIGEAKQLAGMLGGKAGNNHHPYQIGTAYLIRTVTMIYTGRLVAVYDQELLLEEVAWIAETDRWADTCRDGKVKEVEPYVKGDKVIISRGGILDVSEWHKSLPSEQK